MKIFTMVAAMFAALVSFSVSDVYAGPKVHSVVYHVDQNDPKVMNLALNNVQNMIEYYAKKGEKINIEIVANGPGILMFADDSPVKDRIAVMALANPELKFAGCGISKRKIGNKLGKEINILSEIEMIPSGVVRLVELQENGFAYIRP